MGDRAGDRALIERVRTGDGAALSDLAAEYGPKIQRLALRYLKNREDAEEVAQDVLMKVYRKLSAFRGDAALSSWIFRITFNTAMSRLRITKHARAGAGPDGGAAGVRQARDLVDWSTLADDELMRNQLRQRLVEALPAVPPVYRAPVILRDIQGLSTEEASAILRVKPQTLKSRLHRGRLILRGKLAEFASGLSLHRAS
ncbi:MAG: sigma-70 family RNA polymerase sigma factor [Acidobacteria bacterium]|nr:sigma-70 family RNA polymerase sigma factor [Acidobacteriota bacterium]